ncbi:GlxA family transcriptional regulator [Acetobacter sp. KSO5]|uniref:GlxA family transcriptional regulator n=1 Tax=Acetobacter sp. KSO5 TaxID=3373674 RepID=UPI00376EB0A1
MAGHGKNMRKIGILALPGAQMLDISGPLDVFAEANSQIGYKAYALFVVGISDRPIESSSGMRFLPDCTVDDALGRFDTLLIAGAPGLKNTHYEPKIVDWIRRVAPDCRRYGSICTGALLLGASGLLDGRRVTTHWAVVDQLARACPAAEIEADALHVRDGPLRTAAGVTAGLDLALSLVEEDCGLALAKDVASQLVMFFRRPGGQLQFSRRGEVRPAGRSIIQDIQRWLIAHPDEDASTAALANRAGLSARHFTRIFNQELGITPAQWVEQIRIDLARARLEAGDYPKQVAVAFGFRDIDTFRRAFQRQTGVTPAVYRRRFGGMDEQTET